MKWILIILTMGHGFDHIDMESKEACTIASKKLDDNSVSDWYFCLNTQTGEVVQND